MLQPKMNNDMEILFEKIKEQMAIQTEKITESVTKNVSENIDAKLKTIMEENKSLKTEVRSLQAKIKYMDSEKRRNNILIFGAKENQYENMIEEVKKIIETQTEAKIENHEINKAYRLGAKGEKTRPILVSFTTTWKRNEIMRKKNKTATDIYFKEDLSKETLEKRRELLPKLKEERERGKLAYIRGDKLIVREPIEGSRDKRKRNSLESPNTSPSQEPAPAPKKKINKTTNMFDYMARGRSASLSEKSKN